MGSGAAALFAAAGVSTVLLARTREKAEAGRTRAQKLVKGKLAAIDVGTYDDDLVRAVGRADLVFEAVSEQLSTKREVLAMIDRVRGRGTIVATVSSGLSIATLCDGRSEDFQRNFLGIHLFNPPTALRGCELIPHRESDPEIVEGMRRFLEITLDRVVIESADTPAFAGNRIGFKVLNEVAQLAEEHGVAYMDQLVGTHTGRALPPLATIDLVGWDIHKSIVDNLWDNTEDEAHASFELPAYMQRGIDAGHLGRKTRDKGGFFRLDGTTHLVLDPATFDYRPLADMLPPAPAFIEQMNAALREGDHPRAFDVLVRAEGKDAEILRRILLGYISYALGLVGDVVERARDADRIMAFGFHWAPPTVLVDAIGAARTIKLLERADLSVPPVIIVAAAGNAHLSEDVDSARFLRAAG